MAATAAAKDGTNECAAEATVRSVDGLLAVYGIQSRAIGFELAWGRTPTEVPCIILIFRTYFLHLYIY
jgi:hypothetical protein